jgi:ABC-type multidrug transport system ATPase subunit
VPQLTLQNISKSYGKQTLFKNLSSHCNTGQILSISGPNGSGKSSLSKIICGQSSPTTGSVNLDGSSVKAGNFSICSPHTALYEAFTVNELYDFTTKLHPLKISKKELADFLMFTPKLCRQRRIEKFSSGMKQRVKLAFAFMHPGEILILDEPSSNLDENARQWYLDGWKTVQSTKINLIATNNLEQECPFPHNAINLPNYQNI